MRYFSRKELECPCCGFHNIDPKFHRMLDRARENSGVPFPVNSAVRCAAHNAKVGGAENSAHTLGVAIDIRVDSSWHRFKILRALVLVGFERIGIYETFIHADVDSSKTAEVVWYK